MAKLNWQRANDQRPLGAQAMQMTIPCELGANATNDEADSENIRTRRRRCAAELRAGSILVPQDAAFVADLLDGDPGLPKPIRSQRTYETAQNLKRRDEQLRLAAVSFCSHIKSERGRAGHLAAELARYRASAWQRGERFASRCPPRHAGRIQSGLWEILQCSDTPLSAERIRKALGRRRLLR